MEMTTKKASDDERPSARAEKPVELKHQHPRNVRETIIGVDDNGRRVIGIVQDEPPSYFAACKACQAADKARMAAQPNIAHLEATMFLIPETQYDGMIARAYVAARYPEAENVVHQFSAEKLSYVKGAQVVVITRRGKNGKVGPRYKRTKDEEGTFYDQEQPPELYLDEIVESDPVVVDQHISVTAGTMYNEQSADFGQLVARLAERAVPFRIAPPNPPDKLYVMRLNS